MEIICKIGDFYERKQDNLLCKVTNIHIDQIWLKIAIPKTYDDHGYLKVVSYDKLIKYYIKRDVAKLLYGK